MTHNLERTKESGRRHLGDQSVDVQQPVEKRTGPYRRGIFGWYRRKKRGAVNFVRNSD